MMDARKRRIAAMLLSGAMLLTLLPAGALAAEGNEPAPQMLEESAAAQSEARQASAWADAADTSWYQEGESSFTISTPEALAGLAKLVNEGNNFSGKTVSLTADIDLAGREWTPIGQYLHVKTPTSYFAGVFDGNDHRISGLSIHSTANLDVDSAENIYQYCGYGLFGAAAAGSVFRNLTIVSPVIDLSDAKNVGALLGGIGYQGTSAPAVFQNIHIIDASLTANARVGGIVGWVIDSTAGVEISNCTVTGDITAKYNTTKGDDGDKAGGIVGQNQVNTTLLQCTYSDGTVSAYREAAGIVGTSSSGNLTVLGCTVRNARVVQDISNGVNDNPRCGRLIGRLDSNSVTIGGNVMDNVTLDANNQDDANGIGTEGITATTKAASIGNEYYESLSDALSAAQDGDTVKLLADFTVSTDEGTEYNVAPNVVLDLGGNTLDIPHMCAIFQGEMITIQNGHITSQGNYGLFLGNGTILNTAVTVQNVSMDCGINAYYAKVTLKDVTIDISQKKYYAIYSDPGADITVESGTFTANSGGISTMTFGGGDDPEDDPGKLTILGGTFYGKINVYDLREGTNVIDYSVVKGGTFNFDPSEYVPDGYSVRQNGDTFTVSRSSSSGSSSGASGDKTETVTNPDGSTTTTVTKPSGTVTETTRQPDGSQQVVETKPDGTITETTTDTDGNKTETVTKPDGSATTTVEHQNGASSTTTVTQDGQTETQVKLPETVVDSAQESGAAVALPMPGVSASSDKDSAPVVKVELSGDTDAKVEIPVENVTPGTVAVIVREDGTEEIIKTTLTTENGVAVTLSDGDTVKIVDNSKTFEDVSGSHWGADAIDFATSRELFQGTSDTIFSPEGEMTRAMIVTVLARYEGVDTDGSVWYEAGQQWAMESGISDGSSMEEAVSREQLAVMLWRYAGSPAISAGLDFADGDSVSDWAAEAMAWAVENGLINGMGDGTLNPQGQATRAQVAAILARFVQYANG